NALLDMYLQFFQQAKTLTNSTREPKDVVEHFNNNLQTLRQLSSNDQRIDRNSYSILDFSDQRNCLIIYSWLILQSLGYSEETKLYDRLRLDKALKDIFESFNFNNDLIQETTALIKLLLSDFILFSEKQVNVQKFYEFSEVQEFIQLNEHESIRYFNKERFEEMVKWFFIKDTISNKELMSEKFMTKFLLYRRMLDVSIKSEYKFDKFKQLLSEGG
ncbi:MAG: hypothetical protein HY800_09870, partial [Ignavibacteriales bacterium]|nr:hypothetical protein [Ignavibacteriales bacterium]